MRLGFLIAIPVVLLSGLSAHAQRPDTLKTAYETNQVFELRDAVSRMSASPLYRGAVEASSNNTRAAEEDLRSVIQHAPHSQDAYEAHDLLGNMYFRNGMYRDGYGEITSALYERPDASDAKEMLSIFSALNSLPRMKIVKAKHSRINIEPGSIFLPLRANGKDLAFFFDTGSGISLIGESEAKELGILTEPVKGKMGDASGQGVSGLKLALVADFRLGGLHVRNVPFLVIPDTGEPWNHLPRNRHGIIGLPLLLAMHTVQWTPSGKFEFGFPAQPLNLDTCNMLFHNATPVIDLVAEGKHLNFTLDTGAEITDLYPQFAKAFPTLMKTGKPESQSIEGLGGSIVSSSVLLPAVTFQIGGESAVLKPAHVFTERDNGIAAAGNLGMDLLKQAHAFTLDFGAMTLRLQ